MMTAKENVIRTLRHDNPEWIPVNLWQLPAAKLKYGQALDDIINRCEIDILSAPFDDPTEDALTTKSAAIPIVGDRLG